MLARDICLQLLNDYYCIIIIIIIIIVNAY